MREAAGDVLAAYDGARELRFQLRRLRSGRANPAAVVADAERRLNEVAAAVRALREAVSGG